MVVKQAIPCQSFDVDQILSLEEAKAFVAAGYLGVGRYFPHVPTSKVGNLTTAEMKNLITAGLSVFVVQHCPLPNWMPTGELGTEYAKYGGSYLNWQEYPKGAIAFLDLEMVSKEATATAIIEYCNNWFDGITAAGFVPGIYIGYQTGLSDAQLYGSLKFKSYWRAYNCDQSIPTRGWQIIQHTAKTLNGISYDPNTIQADNKGDLPMWVSPS
jgi:hypothetical protein